MTKARTSRTGSSRKSERGFGGGSSTGAGPAGSGMTAGPREQGRREAAGAVSAVCVLSGVGDPAVSASP
jgi:hypothetical protein